MDSFYMKTCYFWRKGLKSEEFGRKENRDCLSQKMNLHKTSLGIFSKHTLDSLTDDLKNQIGKKTFEGTDRPNFGKEKYLELKWAKSKGEKFPSFENEKSNVYFFDEN